MAACSSSENEQESLTPAYTLVFLDKTQSVNPNDSFVRNKYAAALKTLVEENIRTEGDQLEVYFIHENTSKARAMTVRSRTLREDTRGLSSTDIEAAQNAYEISIRKEREVIYQALLQKLMEANTSSSNTETHVSAAVPVIASALESGAQVQAWFFSDMVESRRTGRNFHTKPPQNAEQATAWAKEDAAAYSATPLTGAEVRVILPFPPNSSSKVNNPHVSTYWNTFFAELNAGRVVEN